VLGAKHASQTRRRFIKNVVDIGSGPALLFEVEGGGQSGDASADDGDASQKYSSAAKAGLILRPLRRG